MGFFFSKPRRAGSLFLEVGLIFGGAKLHETCSIGHDHLAMVVVEAIELVEAWWRRKLAGWKDRKRGCWLKSLREDSEKGMGWRTGFRGEWK